MLDKLLSLSLSLDLVSEGRSISRLICPFYQSTSTDGCVAIHWRDNRHGRLKNTGGQCHPPSPERPTAPWPLCSSLAFVPWLLATVYCQFSRAKKKKKPTSCDEIMRAVTSRNGTFYRSGIKQGER